MTYPLCTLSDQSFYLADYKTITSGGGAAAWNSPSSANFGPFTFGSPHEAGDYSELAIGTLWKKRARLKLHPYQWGDKTHTVMQIETHLPKPGRWKRFWYWALLGWEWDDINE